MGRYHAALCQEIKKYGDSRCIDGKKEKIDTIFIGGGTPSTYPPDLLLDMAGILKELFLFDSTTEFSLEVNPGTVSREKLDAWQKAGINRLSIGVQSLDDAVLARLNRHQKVADVEWLIHEASPLFNSLSVDLIIGMPGVSAEGWKKTVQTIVQWPIKHVSIYFLTVHEDTPLFFSVAQKKIMLPHDDETVKLYHWSRDLLREYGFYQYEISNFARKGYESRHNSAYWARVPYKAFGLGAASFDGTMRAANHKNLLRYLELVEHGNDAYGYVETLTREQMWLEKIMLGVRQMKGVFVENLKEDVDEKKFSTFLNNVHELATAGLVTFDTGVLSLTEAGLALENEVVLKLITV